MCWHFFLCDEFKQAWLWKLSLTDKWTRERILICLHPLRSPVSALTKMSIGKMFWSALSFAGIKQSSGQSASCPIKNFESKTSWNIFDRFKSIFIALNALKAVLTRKKFIVRFWCIFPLEHLKCPKLDTQLNMKYLENMMYLDGKLFARFLRLLLLRVAVI